MAQKEEAHLKDDLDDDPVDETATFPLDNKDHEIDLFAANAEKQW